MRTTIAKLALVVVFVIALVGVAAAPARADGGNPFQPTDGRVNPTTEDRIAVYCNPATIDVLGLDNDNNGAYLTSFSMAEFTSFAPATHKGWFGTITLNLVQAPVANMGQITVNNITSNTVFISTPASYLITWTGGPYGANGSLPFIKHFNPLCLDLF